MMLSKTEIVYPSDDAGRQCRVATLGRDFGVGGLTKAL